jgi:hypothetical protein
MLLLLQLLTLTWHGWPVGVGVGGGGGAPQVPTCDNGVFLNQAGKKWVNCSRLLPLIIFKFISAFEAFKKSSPA